jgi:DnaK suppressor protein
MIPENREAIKKDIQDRIGELHTRIATLEISSKPIAPDSALGRLTRMDAMQMKAVGEAGLERLRLERDTLERTLLIIDTPEFGMCRFCKKEIGFERLKALPGTNTCIECAEKLGT